jgi:hypothetical protein
LYDDFAIFGRSAYTAFGFQSFAEFFEIVVSAYESSDERYRLTTTIAAVEFDAEVLFGRFECVYLWFVVGFVLIVGVSRIDYI